MRRRIAVLGITDDAVDALPRLASDPNVELVCVFDSDAVAAGRRLALYEPHAAALLQKLLTDDPAMLAGLELVPATDLSKRDVTASPLAPDAKGELIEALGEIAAAAALVADPEALAARLLEASIAATGATGGSLLRIDPAADVLRVAAAVGLERELWSKVALAVGRGLAGRAWAERRPLLVRGRADPVHFEIERERHDVAGSACTPVVHDGRTLGVLCLHHATRADLFAADDADALAAIGAALGRIAAQADAHVAARDSALRRALDAEVRAALAPRAPLAERLATLCRIAATRAGGGIATLWWNGDDSLRLLATSLPGGALGAAARLAPGDGVDGRAARERVAVFLPRDGGGLAYAALPLLDGDRLLGVLSIQLGDAPLAAGESLWRAFADAAAEALGRDGAQTALQQRALRSEALHEAALRLLAERDVDRIAEQLASAATLVLEAEHVVVRVLDPARKSFRVRTPAGAPGLLDDDALALDRRGAREALRTRAPIDAPGDDDDGGAGPWLIVPILAGDRALGTLGLYGKRPPAEPRFDALDRESAVRLAAYAARALAEALPRAPHGAGARLLTPDAFARRLDQEIARAADAPAGAASFLLLTCLVENADALGVAETERVMDHLAGALGAQLRSFDAAARSEPDRLMALLPEPGGAPAERVARLARALTGSVEAISRDAVRPVIAFGHALHPDAGASRTELLAAAATPRIRML